MLEYLQDNGVVHKMANQWHWTESAYPAQNVSLRSIAEENFVVVNRDDSNRILAEVDFSSAPQTIYPEAIYLAEGNQYVVEELDWDNRKAFVRETDSDYFTDAIDYTNVRILDEFEQKTEGPISVEHGEVHVVTKSVGYKKIKFYTSENVGYGKIELPDQEMHTTAYWFTIPENILESLPYQRADLIDGILGMSYVLHYVASLSLMCEVSDIDRAIGDRSAEWYVRSTGFERGIYSGGENGQQESAVAAGDIERFQPTIFLYDNYPGGVGFSPELFDEHSILLRRSLEVIQQCGCDEGCPSCVGPTKEVGIRSKEVSVQLLKKLI
jgi:DEAD/DEAH box helicase domain-containing protein